MDAGADRVGEGRGEGGAEESDAGGVWVGLRAMFSACHWRGDSTMKTKSATAPEGVAARPDARRAASLSTCTSDGEGCANTPDPCPNA